MDLLQGEELSSWIAKLYMARENMNNRLQILIQTPQKAHTIGFQVFIFHTVSEAKPRLSKLTEPALYIQDHVHDELLKWIIF